MTLTIDTSHVDETLTTEKLKYYRLKKSDIASCIIVEEVKKLKTIEIR